MARKVHMDRCCKGSQNLLLATPAKAMATFAIRNHTDYNQN
jgi:hypothetical protein